MGNLWQQSDDVIDRYLKAAVRRLSQSALVPLIAEPDITDKYEFLINQVAEELFLGDN
jgi:hypothetical protein